MSRFGAKSKQRNMVKQQTSTRQGRKMEGEATTVPESTILEEKIVMEEGMEIEVKL